MTQSILTEALKPLNNIGNIGNIAQVQTPMRDETQKAKNTNGVDIKNAAMQATPKTPMTTLKRIGDSPANDSNLVSKREAFKEKLAPIPMNGVCTVDTFE